MAHVTSNLNLAPIGELTRGGRYAVLAAAFLGLAFDGVERGSAATTRCSAERAR